MRLEGKVALISGIARGMGRATALRFAREGAIVAGGDLLEDQASETLTLIESAGGQVRPRTSSRPPCSWPATRRRTSRAPTS
jgi:NAD(P)-dependent dehydrogenase (short-subunit alcohol dehydrogenase family)